MPFASAISPHSIQASPRGSHVPGAKGIGGPGQGNGSEAGPNFAEVLRGQAGVVSQAGGGVAKQDQDSVPVSRRATEQGSEKASGKGAGEISEQANGMANAPAANQVQIKEALKAKLAAEMDSPSAELQAISNGETQAADADHAQAATINAAEVKALEITKKDDNAKLALPGADAGHMKVGKEKGGKDGKSDKADKIIAAQTSAEKPQIPVQAGSLVAAAAVTVSAPLRSASPKSAKDESVVSPHGVGATVTAAKSDSDQQVRQASITAAGGKIQGPPDGAHLPTPDASPAPQDIQSEAEELSAATNSAESPDVKNAGKQDASAIAVKAESGAVAPAKRQDSSLPAAVHPAQVAQPAVSGTAQLAAQFSASSQNSASVSGPASSASSAASPYDRIDQGSAPVVLHSGAQQVVVGVHDPGLGWVEIKTQSAAGHVDATLVAASGQTHDTLAAQLPAISQFLEQRDVRIGTIAVQQQSAGNGANHFGNNSGGGGAGAQHAGPGNGGNGGSSGNGGNSGSERHAPRYNAPAPARPSGLTVATGGENSSPPRPLSYISVRA